MKRRGFIPSGSGLSDGDILQYATEELRSYIPAFLKGLREEFIIATLDISVTSGVVPIPARAVGAALRTIGWVQGDGRVRQLPRIEPENAGQWAGQTGEPVGYEFQGNTATLLPAPSSGTLRVSYQQRPGQLVSVDECCLVESINAGAFTLTVATRPSSFVSTSPPVALMDFVSGSPNFTAYALDVSSQGWDDSTSPVFNLSAAQLASAAVGDYLCLAGETCIPQVPLELFDLLAQATARTIAIATGSQRAPGIIAAFEKLEKDMTKLLSPRSDGSARVIVSRSRIGRWNGW